MKYNFSEPVLDWDGKLLPKSPVDKSPEIIGTIAFMALTAPQQAAIDEICKCSGLGLDVRKGGVHDIDSDDQRRIKERAAVLATLNGGGPLLATRLAQFIDRKGPYTEPEPAKSKGAK